MSKLNNEQYTYRKESAASKMAENKENCNTLTEVQHDLIEEICTIRHEIHCDQDSVFNTESSSHNKFINFLDNINLKLKKVELNIINFNIDFEMLITDFDYYEMESFDSIEDAKEKSSEECTAINNDIELFLKNIDKKHGTNYCPTGSLRIV